MNVQNIVWELQKETPTNQILTDIIQDHAVKRNWMKKLYEEYKGNVPVKHREYEYNENEKIDKKLANDYRGYIVDTLTGYTFGTPVSYTIDKDQYESEDIYNQLSSKLKMFIRSNSLADVDAETAKKASICGYGARLLYINKDGQERIMNVDPWECVFIDDPSTDEPDYALRYYSLEYKNDKGQLEQSIHAEWYDREYIEEFEQINGVFFPVEGSKKKHMFNGVPLIEFPNNEERIGDFEKVRELIDGYDCLVSDTQSELEEQRLAYMVFTGAQIDGKTMQEARKTGAFSLPDPSDSVSYLVKNLNDTVIENHKATLRENIHKFSKTVDMSDEKFSGASQSGESRKWKLLAMENLAVIKERKFTKSARVQFRMIEDVWITKLEPILPDTITWNLVRNLPIELTQEATVLSMLNGVISNKTRLSLASFIDDPESEITQMEEDRQGEPIPELIDEDDELDDEEEEEEEV